MITKSIFDQVEVTLTPYGKSIYPYALNSSTYTFQLWELMYLFGAACASTEPVFVDNSIRFIENDGSEEFHL